jgi:hypothetical protein
VGGGADQHCGLDYDNDLGRTDAAVRADTPDDLGAWPGVGLFEVEQTGWSSTSRP